MTADRAATPSIAAHTISAAHSSAITENVFILTRDALIEPADETSPGAEATPPESILDDSGYLSGHVEEYSDGDSISPLWSHSLTPVLLPLELLWKPPLANQREPNMYGKFTNLNDESTIETAIAGQFGLVRFAPANRPSEGIQIDGFAAVFTRFNEQRLLTAADYRVGVPVTYRKGRWQTKISYEHTSTHLGDEFIEANGRRQAPHVRDEIVFGLARQCFRDVRVYGQFGYSFLTSNVVGEDRTRFDWGIEWSFSGPTSWKGKPFAAYDMDIRSDQDYTLNSTAQVGWEWKPCRGSRSARFVFEYYNGRSPYGQFFLDYEDWIGVAGLYGW